MEIVIMVETRILFLKKEPVYFYFLIRPILIAFQLVGLLPISNIINEKKNSSKLNFRFCSYCTHYTILFYISTITIVIYLSVTSEISRFGLVFHLIDYLEAIVIALIRLLSVRSTIKLIQFLDTYDHNVLKHPIWKRDKKKVKKSYLFRFYFVLFLFFRLSMQYTFFKMGVYHSILVLFIQSYIVAPLNMTSFLFSYFCTAIKSRFELLNETLLSLVLKNDPNLLSNSIEKIRLLHFQLIRCLKYLDLSFGWTMSALYFLTISKGLRTVFNMSYFPEHTSFHYMVYLSWNILSMTITIVVSDSMLTKSREVKHIIMMTRMSRMNDKFYDEVELLILQVETLVEKVEKRKVLSINKEILGLFILLFVIYFITLVQFSPRIIHLLQKFNNTVSKHKEASKDF